MYKYANGSDWGRWDLHIHTPYSELNNQFGEDWDLYVKKLFNVAIEKDIKAIGITDYFYIKGYKKIKNEYINNEEKLKTLFYDELLNDSRYIEKIKSILLLPNIELRLDDQIYFYKDGNNYENKKIEYHIIFDNNVLIEDIEDNFLNQLQLKSFSSVNNGIDELALTESSLNKLGQYVKTCQNEFKVQTDLEAGMNTACVNLTQMLDVLEKKKNMFKNKYLLILVEDDITKIKWSGGCHITKKSLYSVAHAIFSQNKKTISWGLSEATKNEFSSHKPCIWGSDAHEFSRLFNPDNMQYCWIKSNPTFEGLKQILTCPAERVFIGVEPPKLTFFKNNKAKYIKSIKISKKDSAKNNDIWFDNTIPINIGLTTIIGNKGSGKSALSDIIGLTCNSKNIDCSSFLAPDRFKKPNKGYANDYYSVITWQDGKETKCDSLSNNYESTNVELAQYLPQRYIEAACNNLGREFQKEIDNVIFSYIDIKDKHDTQSLEDLKDTKNRAISIKIQDIRKNIESINLEIIKLEDKKKSSYYDLIVNNLNLLKEEIERVKSNKPAVVIKPLDRAYSEQAKEIIYIDSLIEKNQEEISKKKLEISEINNELLELNNSLFGIKEFINSYNKISKSVSYIKEKYNINTNELNITIQINTKGIDNKIDELNSQKSELEKSVDSTFATKIVDEQLNKDIVGQLLEITVSLINKNIILNKYKELLKSKISAEEQNYQLYTEDVKKWTNRINELQNGSENVRGISYYQKEKNYIDSVLNIELEEMYIKRLEYIKDLYSCKKEIVEIYKEIYRPVEDKLKEILKEIESLIKFTVDIRYKEKFAEDILGYINQNVISDFRGVKEGYDFVNSKIRERDFNDYESIISFVSEIFKSIHKDNNYDKIDKLFLKGDSGRIAFYNYLCELSYLTIDYTLRMGDKTLDELSPGERGAVLLIFYLTLEKSNCPLIIDQPEDNLDNESVFMKIVPCIKAAKTNRQVIIVTHNPNIAIACDAEEIICCSIDKTKNEIRYSSGAIENNSIKDQVIKVLEGTKPAFDLRNSKYN